MRGVKVGGLVVAACVMATVMLAQEGKKYGDGVSLTDVTPIADVLAAPESFVGKRIRVDGEVAAVCEEMGCWIELRAPNTEKGLRFKVDDGVIVFPMSAKGRRASAEGTLERIDVPAGKTEHDMMHAAEGKPAAAAAHAGAAPKAPAKTVYQVRATGAVIF